MLFRFVKLLINNKTNSFPTIISDNLILRELRNSDAEEIAKIITERVIKYLLASIPYPYKISDGLDFIQDGKISFELDKSVRWAIELKSKSMIKDYHYRDDDLPQSLFGGIISVENIDNSNKNGNVGFWLGERFWNKRIGTEARRAVTCYFLSPNNKIELHKLYAYIFSSNIYSCKIFENTGFTKEGTLKEHFVYVRYHEIRN